MACGVIEKLRESERLLHPLLKIGYHRKRAVHTKKYLSRTLQPESNERFESSGLGGVDGQKQPNLKNISTSHLKHDTCVVNADQWNNFRSGRHDFRDNQHEYRHG